MTAPIGHSRTGMDHIAALLPAGMMYALLIPAGLTVEVGGMLFYASRIYLVAMLPFIIAQCVRIRLHLRLADYLILAGCGWMVISFLANRGVAGGIQSGGKDSLDILGTWFLVRGSLRSEKDLERMLKLVLPGLLVVGAVLFLEAATGRFRIINVFPVKGAGGSSLEQYRLGFLRAFGPFSHAILAGLFVSSFITLYSMVVKQQTQRWLGMAAGLAGFFTLSSAAIANMALQAGFLIYRALIRVAGYRTEWRPLALGTIVLFAMLQVLSQGGAIMTIIRYGALDSATGFYRLLIWEYGWGTVASSPLFGIGYEDYDRPAWMVSDSVDNHWLLIAIRYGIPALIIYLSLALFLIYQLGRISMKLPDTAAKPFTAVMITTICATALGLTVAYVNEFQIWYIFVLATGAALIQSYERRVALHGRIVHSLQKAQAAPA